MGGGGGLEMVLWFFLYLPLSPLPPTRPVSMRLKSKQAGRGKDSKKGENALHIIYSIFISSPVKLYFMEHFPPPSFPHPPLWIIKKYPIHTVRDCKVNDPDSPYADPDFKNILFNTAILS